jgi:uncharacterized metal-binding protein
MGNTSYFHIVSCSGASNTGKFSDEVARKLMHSGEVKMLCLARFAIDKPWAENAKKDIGKIIVLDGCPINCAEKTMLESGIANYVHINTTDFGIIKGKTPYSDEKANEIVEHIRQVTN